MNNNIVSLNLQDTQKLRLEFMNAVLNHSINQNTQDSPSIIYPGIYDTVPEKMITSQLNKLCELFKPTEPSIFALNVNGDSIIHIAAYYNLFHLLPILHELGIDINTKTKSNVTPLIVAASTNATQACDVLLNLGAHINHTADGGWTALNLSILNHFTAITDRLQSQGAILDVHDRYGNNISTTLAQEGDSAALKKLFDAGLSIHHRNAKQETVILTACKYNQLITVKQLQKWGANINDGNLYNQTPLHIAILYKDEHRIRRLIEFGANIEALDDNKETPLMNAVATGVLSLAKLLVQFNANIHHVDCHGNGLVHIAAQYGHPMLIRYVIDQGLDINYRNAAGHTPLMVAIINQKVSSLECLRDLGADTSIRSNTHRTAFEYAQESKNKTIIKLMSTLIHHHSTHQQSICPMQQQLDTHPRDQLVQNIVKALNAQLPIRACRLLTSIQLTEQAQLAEQIIPLENGDSTTLFDTAIKQLLESQAIPHIAFEYRVFLSYVCHNDYFATLKFEDQTSALRTLLDFLQVDEKLFYSTY